jgi:hypothetical protein
MIFDLEEIVHRETRAWNTQDVKLLLSIFHADMVWVWPKNSTDHNPIDWETPQGKFNYSRWKDLYSEMFSNFSLESNDRKIIKIVETNEKDGGFAVVDIDTLWKNKLNGEFMHWLGRTCKTYVKTNEGYKMIAQTGALRYE